MGHIIIVGAGKVGHHIAERLASENWDVSVIDQSPDHIERLASSLDVRAIEGNGSSPQVLKAAGIERSDMLLAVTDSDETNIVACLVAKTYAPPQCRKIARIRNPDYTEDNRLFQGDFLGIDFHINPELASAKQILRLLRTPQASDIHTFGNGRVLMLGMRLPEASSWYGKSFAEISALYPDHRFLAAALRREGTLLIPRGSDRIMRGDTVFLVTTPEQLNNTLERLGVVSRSLRTVAIAGGGLIGEFMARQLEEQGISVRLFESDRKRCKYLANQLNRTVVLHGDPTERKLLEQENIGQMDAFVAVTDDEETNFLSSLLAKRMGTKKVMSLVNKEAYAPLAEEIGIDAAIIPRQVVTNLLMHAIRRGNVLQVDDVAESQAEVSEFVVGEHCVVAGVPLAQSGLPKGSLVGALIRNEEVVIPWGGTTIMAGDRVIVFSLQQAATKVERLFCPK